MKPEDSRAEAPDDDQLGSDAALRDKLTDALFPGYKVEFDPDEAETAGAFQEHALSEADAAESGIDLVDASSPEPGGAHTLGKA